MQTAINASRLLKEPNEQNPYKEGLSNCGQHRCELILEIHYLLIESVEII